MALTYIELSVACCSLPEKTSECAVICCLFRKNGNWIKLTQTEIVYKSNNPRFADSLKVEYQSGMSCYYKLAVYAAKKESVVETLEDHLRIAEAEFVIDELFTSTAKLELELTYQGTVIPNAVALIWAELFGQSKYDITMQLFCTKLQKKTDSFLEISKLQKDGVFTLVHRTDVVHNSVNPRWSTFSEPIWKLCGNQWDRQLFFCMYRWNKNGKHEEIGYFYTSLEEICSPDEHGSADIREIKLMTKGRKKYETAGTLHFASVRAIPVYCVRDYIINGFDIKLSIAIDYTKSNGTPTSPTSLHYISKSQDNEYIYCLKTLMSLMDKHNYDPEIAAYGFGACLPGSEVASDCFPLNGNTDNPYIGGLENVIKAYEEQLKSVRLHGPTNYSDILDKVIEQALLSVSREDRTYHHLVILTDGVVNDKVNTAKKIALASGLPLSLTIIGVGTADFTTVTSSLMMADDHNARAATHNIIKFVPLRQCLHTRGSNFSLCDEVDQALSEQFLDYMKIHMIKPKKFRPSLSSLSSAVSQSSEWQPYLKRNSVSSSISSATMS